MRFDFQVPFTLFIFFLLYPFSVFAQSECGTSEPPDSILDTRAYVLDPTLLDSAEVELNRIRDDKASLRSGICIANSYITVPLFLHFILPDGLTLTDISITPREIQEMMDAINAMYQNSGFKIRFYAACYEEVQSTANDTITSALEAYNMHTGLFSSLGGPNMLNIYIVGQVSFGDDIQNGVYYGVGDFIVTNRSVLTSGTSTLAHELGHYFELEHTIETMIKEIVNGKQLAVHEN